jgi:zinc transport system substrate-binding protein
MLRAVALTAAIVLFAGCMGKVEESPVGGRVEILASDTLLSGMTVALLPPDCAYVEAILPPAQCPGHYDVKLSDIQKVKSADLVLSMKGMPFMQKVEADSDRLLLLDDQGRNWMVPDAHIFGLNLLAAELCKRFPEYRFQIEKQRESAIREVAQDAKALRAIIAQAGISEMPVIASSMQKQVMEWMGFKVVAEYGRPEAMSAKEIVRLSQIAKSGKIIMVIDNLQSGPDAGKGIAEARGVPHVILSNFPSEEGYAATLRANVKAVISAVRAGG